MTWFDPWKSPLCTCPKKYSFNPYTGCDHHCLYCYITSYIPNAFKVREKKNLLKSLRRELKRLDYRFVISMSNSSDPYPTIDEKLKITRRVLQIMSDFPIKLLIITKSNIITRDIDILKNMRVAVMFTITTIDNELAKKMELNAPSPIERLEAIKKLSSSGIPVGIRLDPIVPYVNDSIENIEAVIKAAKSVGAIHVVSSTFKPRIDSWKRMFAAFPTEMKKARFLYTDRVGRVMYIKREIRLKLMNRVKEIAENYGLSFATCREGFSFLHTSKTCDGSHLIDLKD
ncbi:MAG: radical SAM protein [Candidatus Odinarchaeota archaeon]|nr:radical SAM protein [Candidatus Odinarchaeota archaeon]